jgi:hypothetical protein
MKYQGSVAGFLVLLTAGQAFADPPRDALNDPNAAVPAVSKRLVPEKQRLSLVEKGKGLTRDGHYAEALTAFREALEVRPDPKVLLWLGYAQEQTGTLLEARESYLEAKSVAHAGKLAVDERSADQALLDIAAKIPRITIKVPSGVGAKIWIDGKRSQPLGDAAEVNPGVHSVVVGGPGWHPYSVAVVAKPGEAQVVEAILSRIPVAPPALATPPEKITSAPPVDGIVVAGVAVTALGAAMGAGFAIASEANRHERDEHEDLKKSDCHDVACEAYNAPERARGHFLTASFVSFLAAGAIGAGTLTYSLVTRAKKTKGGATATVSAGPGGVAGSVKIIW